MSDKMTKTIKVSDDTLYNLDNLKPKYIEKLSEIYVSYDVVIGELIYEHIARSNPKILEEKKRKLLQDYVPRNSFNDVFNKKQELEEKLFELSEKYENIKNKSETELEKLKESFNLEKQKYQDNINNLKQELTTKKEELSLSNQKKNELTGTVMNQEIDLKELQDKFDKCNSGYNSLKQSVTKEYIKKESLYTMYCIARFLSLPLHKHKLYTIHQLHDKIHGFIIEEVLEALKLVNYFPVQYGQRDGIIFYCFDKKYLRH